MPLSEIDQRFANDPLAFMKSYSVQPQDYKDRGAGAVALYDQTPHSYDTPGTKAAFDSMLSVQGADNRVAFTRLTAAEGAGMKNHFNLFFYSRAVARAAGLDSYIPCYFLPWTSDHLTRLKIPPKVPTTGATGRRVSDPDLFITAAINGCSVFVEGDPKNPTVYHAGTTEPRSNLSNTNPFASGSAREHWTNVFERNRAGTGSYGAIHKGDYVSSLGTGTTAEAVQYKAFLENEASRELKIHSVDPEGSVFGVRDSAGAWSFYLQKNVRCVFTRLIKKKSGLLGKTKYEPATVVKNKGFTNESVAEDTRTVWMPVQLLKFFPGSSKSPESARLEPSQIKFILDAYL